MVNHELCQHLIEFRSAWQRTVRWLLVAAAASSVAATGIPSAAPGNNTGGSGKNGADCSIDAAFKAHGKKYIGVATDQGRFSVAENAQVIQDNFGQVTPENR